MAKGQMKSNREVRKPKKTAAEKSKGGADATVASAFAKPSKSDGSSKKK